jgi:transposase
MCLKPSQIEAVPEETARVAHAAFSTGNIYMKMRDEFGPIYDDAQFSSLFPERGQPAEAPWRLALVTIMQFLEDLTDRQAAEAVRGRIDWKYALSLPLTDAGFDYSVLSKFRARLVEGQAEQLLFDQLLTVLQERGLVKAGGKQRTDSTHILAAVRTLSRLELVGETVRAALEALAVSAPDWLRQQVSPDWLQRYGQPLDDYRLPKNEAEKIELAHQIGRDGSQLLSKIFSEPELAELRTLEAVEILRQVWIQQYYMQDNQLRWRDDDNRPPATQQILSPYDPQARGAKKRTKPWFGYRVHFTESCDEDQPHLITNVQTDLAPSQDYNATLLIQHALKQRDLLPSQHFADSAYVSGPLLITTREIFGLDLIGPVLPDTSWQAEAREGFDLPNFQIDWPVQQVTCPRGKTSIYWHPTFDRAQKPVIAVRFSGKDCQPCPDRAQCTQAKAHGRFMSLRPQKEHEAIQQARAYQQTEAFKEQYKVRAGVEGTISQSVVALGMRRSRYRGLARSHLQHLGTAAAINLKRAVNWLWGKPLATTRKSHFAALLA